MSDVVEVGKTYWTPYEPRGKFKVLSIEKATRLFPDESAFGVFVGDHPNGYKDGSAGRYYSKELTEEASDE